MTSAVVIGSTGLVGSNILSTLLSTSKATQPFTAVHAFARRPLPADDPLSKLRPHTSSDASSWPADYASLASPSAPGILFSALGTTYAQAGSLQKQREVDLDQNLAMATAAEQAGTRTYVLISSGGSSASSLMPYMRLKADVEKAVSELPFDHVVILRPGLIMGRRSERRTAEYILRTIASVMGAVSKRWLTDWWAQDAQIIARAAVSSGLLASQGKAPDGTGKVWVVNQGDIVRLGQTEWKD